MRCTVARDAYHTVFALTFVTTSGAIIDTSKPDAEEQFALAEPHLRKGSLELREELLADPVLADRTRHKYAIRNTHGFGSVRFSTAKRHWRSFDASSSDPRVRSHSSPKR